MTDQIEQNKLNLTGYYSQLSEIEANAIQEKELLINAIQAEQAEIKSLLDEYQKIKQQNEIDVIKASLERLSDFKQHLILKIKSEAESSNNSSTTLIPAPAEGGTDAKKLKTEQNNYGGTDNEEIVAKLVEFIDRREAQELVKLYPANVANFVLDFNVNNSVVRDQLLGHYQQSNQNIYDALIKLYQKPELKFQVTVPNIQELTDEDRKYHELILINYPNALPLFWFLVNREPESIKYIVMEFAMDHIIQTNTLDSDDNRPELSLSLNQLLGRNNGANLTDFLRDLFVCFHPKRANKKNKSTNRYFNYVSNLIKNEATLEHSRVLQLWNYMKQCGYDAVSSDDFSFASLDNGNENGFTLSGEENTL